LFKISAKAIDSVKSDGRLAVMLSLPYFRSSSSQSICVQRVLVSSALAKQRSILYVWLILPLYFRKHELSMENMTNMTENSELFLKISSAAFDTMSCVQLLHCSRCCRINLSITVRKFIPSYFIHLIFLEYILQKECARHSRFFFELCHLGFCFLALLEI
jgi:hypothetical protein